MTGRKPVDLDHLSTGACISPSSEAVLIDGFMFVSVLGYRLQVAEAGFEPARPEAAAYETAQIPASDIPQF